MINNDIYDNLRNIPRDKKVAIWGLKKKSFDILTQTLNVRMRVEYFVDTDSCYDGADIFDKKVITKDILCESEDVLLIISNDDYKENSEWINTYLNGRYYIVQIGGISPEIRNCDCIYIYGAGDAGKRTLKILQEQDIEIQGFIDSDINKIGKTWCEHIIFSKDILEEQNVVIISSMYYSEIYDALCESFSEDKIFIDYRNSRKSKVPVKYFDLNSVMLRCKDYPVEFFEESKVFYTVLLNDFKDKKIILYGYNEISGQVAEVFSLLGMEIEFIVDEFEYNDVGEKEHAQYPVKNICDLVHENIDERIVLVVKVDEVNAKAAKCIIWDKGKVLDELGLKYFKHYRLLARISSTVIETKADRLLTYTLVYKSTPKEMLGFYTFGTEHKKKIVILGSSTSNPPIYENYIKSWPEYLYNKYSDVMVISGGISGYDSVAECLKLLRDVGQMKPDLVISYSGVNDVAPSRIKGNPFYKEKAAVDKNIWYGIGKDNRDANDYWVLMECYMRAICEVNGCEFIGILEPALPMKKKEDLSAREKLISLIYDNENMLVSQYPAFVEGVREKIVEYDWMYDLSNVFDNVKETVYRDHCHLNDYGSQLVADAIYNVIEDYYTKRGGAGSNVYR